MVGMRREQPLLRESQRGDMCRFVRSGECVRLALLGEQKQRACWHGGHLIERAHAMTVSAFWKVEEYGLRGQFPRMDVADLSSDPLASCLTGKEPEG